MAEKPSSMQWSYYPQPRLEYNKDLQMYYWCHMYLTGLPMKPTSTKSEPLPSTNSLTNLKGAISFRPHSDEISGKNTSFVRGNTAVKRRYNGEIVPDRRVAYRTSNIAVRANKTPSSGVKEQAEVKKRKSGEVKVTQDENGPRMTIGQVLPECMEMIFGYLDVQSKGRAAQVCRNWKEICYRKSVWKGVEAQMHVKKTHPTVYSSLKRRGIKEVQVLSLQKTFKDLINALPDLSSLNMAGCYNLTDNSLDSAFHKSLPALRRLNLSLCKDVNDANLLRIGNKCKNLEHLDLGGCTKVSNNGLYYIATKLKKLRSLNLRSCRLVSDEGIDRLTILPLLEELGLQDCQKITDESLQHLAIALPGLKRLNLSFCVSITDTGLKSVARLPNLETLNVRSCDNVSDIGVGYLSDDVGGRNLRQLDASFCINVTNTAAKHIAAAMKNLRGLSLSNCSVTDEGLSLMAKSLKKLEVLNIGQCKAVSDKSLEIVAKEMINLRTIDLYGCSNVTDTALKLIRQMPKITDLNRQLHST